MGFSRKAKLEPPSAGHAHGGASPVSNDRWSSESDKPPPYGEEAPSYLGTASNRTSIASAVSASASQISSFSPTAQLQIQAVGYDYNSALGCTKLEQIRVYDPASSNLKYSSLRLTAKSNSCGLVRGADLHSVPLVATVYRWGPFRPPKMKILPRDSTATVEQAIQSDSVPCELLEVRSRSMFSRSQILETSFGTFEWRYAGRDQRKEVNANSLLVMEKIERVSSDGSSKPSKRSIPVAQLVRNDEFRTEGTHRNMGGNGGRLLMDLRPWADSKKVTADDIEAFAVASCICMLKREADRFRENAIAVVT